MSRQMDLPWTNSLDRQLGMDVSPDIFGTYI